MSLQMSGSKRFRLLVGLLEIVCLALACQVISYRAQTENAQSALAFAKWRIESSCVRHAEIRGIDADSGEAIPISMGRPGMGASSRFGQGGWTVSSMMSYRMEEGHIEMYWAGIRDAPFELFLHSEGYEDQSICLGTAVSEPVTVRFSKSQNRPVNTTNAFDLALPSSSNVKGVYKNKANPSATLVFNGGSLVTYREDGKKQDGFFYVCMGMVVLIFPKPSDNAPEVLKVKGITLIDGYGDIWEKVESGPRGRKKKGQTDPKLSFQGKKGQTRHKALT